MNIKVIKTISGKGAMMETNDYALSENKGREGQLISVFPEIEYQEVKGFGGAFTESAAVSELTVMSPNDGEQSMRI